MEVRSKVWVEIDGKPFLGRGRTALLTHIDACGSISEAARRLGLTYKRAWCSIRAMEELMGHALVIRQKGGRGGGEAHLTVEARGLVARYQALMTEIDEAVRQGSRGVF